MLVAPIGFQSRARIEIGVRRVRLVFKALRRQSFYDFRIFCFPELTVKLLNVNPDCLRTTSGS